MKTVIIILGSLCACILFALWITRDKKETKVNGGGGSGKVDEPKDNQTT
jgi:hypothetical protein